RDHDPVTLGTVPDFALSPPGSAPGEVDGRALVVRAFRLLRFDAAIEASLRPLRLFRRLLEHPLQVLPKVRLLDGRLRAAEPLTKTRRQQGIERRRPLLRPGDIPPADLHRHGAAAGGAYLEGAIFPVHREPGHIPL